MPERFDDVLERFDDDRLLAFALGLEDDAELEQALAASWGLRERLERVRADLGVIERGVQAAVPPAAEAWADLSAPRWNRLRPYLRAEQPARRRFAGRRLLAPAAATILVAAVALGVVLSHGGQAVFQSGGGASKQRTETNGYPPLVGAEDVAGSAAAFRVVVVARAAAVQGDSQAYDVLRVLKGEAPKSLKLTTEVGGELAAGSLAVLYLEPYSDALPSSSPQGPKTTPQAGVSGSPGTTLGSPSSTASPVPQLYLYLGRYAVVQPLPPGSEPSDITLP